MFQIDGKFLPIDTPFEHNEVQYPSNWLRLATAEDKAALGITEVPDPVPHDDRFYWAPGVPKQLEDIPAVDQDGQPLLDESGLPVIQRGLKSQMVAEVKATAGSMLAPTDWKVTRAAEGVKPVDEATLAERAAIRFASDANEAAILACASVDELAALQMVWPAAEVAA